MSPRFVVASLAAVATCTPYTLSAEDSVNEPIVITGTRTQEVLPATNTTVIDKDTVDRSTAIGIAELIGQEAGVQVRSSFKGLANGILDFRGFGSESASQNSLILLDGRRINDNDLSSPEFSSIPVTAIERIEVIKGGAAAVLYGSGAVAVLLILSQRLSSVKVERYG